MNRVYLPLLPLPVLAVLVAVSACSKARTEETTHVIPPAVTLPPPFAALPPPPVEAKAPAPRPAIAAGEKEDQPTAEDVKEFERPVMK